MGCVGNKARNDHRVAQPFRTDPPKEPSQQPQSKPDCPSSQSIPVPAASIERPSRMSSSDVKKQILQKYLIFEDRYSIHVKDSSNRVLSVNSYNYETLLNHNPAVIAEVN